MKTFIFDKASEGVKSFGALPKAVWQALGVLELICVLGLVIPLLSHRMSVLTVVAALVLAIESLVFIYVHAKYRERGPIIMSGTLGIIMLIVACGRIVHG